MSVTGGGVGPTVSASAAAVTGVTVSAKSVAAWVTRWFKEMTKDLLETGLGASQLSTRDSAGASWF